MSPAHPTGPRTLCVGDALVDLIGERHAALMGDVGRFIPYFGGTVANVAAFAARAGSRVSLAGGAGDDNWGRWLLDRLRREEVDTSYFALLPGVRSQLAFVSIDEDGEPAYELYGDSAQAVVASLGGRLQEAVGDADGLFISTNTLAGDRERELTMRARQTALDLGRPVIFDCNVRLHRWSSRADAAASANACVPGAMLVRANQAEAELMTGESDPERAALALRKAGAGLVVLTLGAGGAILRGNWSADVAAVPVDVVSTVGAGDALTGTLLARLAMSGFYPPAAAASLHEAVQAAARACTRWGALD